MRNLCLCLLFVMILNFQAFADIKLETIPVSISYNGVITHNDTTIAYGTSGALHISFNNYGKWEQQCVFKKGTIQSMFWEDERIVGFNDFGDVAISNDDSKTWSIAHKFNDSILSVLKFPGGYFIRSLNRIFTVGLDFNIIHEKYLYSKPDNINSQLYFKFTIAFFKNNLIIEDENANFLRYDLNLNFIDTVSFSNLGLCTDCISGNQMKTDSNYLYVVVDSKIFRTSDYVNWDSLFTFSGSRNLYKTGNGQNIAIEANFEKTPFTMKAYNIVDKDSVIKLAEFKADVAGYPIITDLIIQNGNIFVIGKENFITYLNTQDSTMNVLSFLNSISIAPTTIIEKTGDSSYLFLTERNLFKTEDNGITFKPVVSFKDSYQYFQITKINFFYFDNVKKTLYLGGANSSNNANGIYITDDYGKSFEYKSVKYYSFTFMDPKNVAPKLANYPIPIQKTENGFVTSGNGKYGKTIDTRILTFDQDFNTISYFFDTSHTIAIDFVDSKDTNSFLVHCLNVKDNTYEIKYTTNKGQNWDMIKKYDEPDSMFFFNDLQINGKRTLVMFYYNPTDSMYSVEALDVENRSVNEIYKYKILKPNYNTQRINGICVENDTVYIAIEDTIFFTTDIYSRSKWNYYLLPDRGQILHPIQKIGDSFWTGYMDTNYVRYTVSNLFWLKILPDSAVSVVEKPENAEETYLYTYPPKPLPARSTVRSLIYFDPRVEFDLDKVGVIDVSGAKIDSKQDITLDRLTPYSGYLTWNCSGVNSGVYFIHVRHGNNARVVKVIVSK